MARFLSVLASSPCDSRGRGSSHQHWLANSRLDCRAGHHGRRVYCECAPLRARALLRHRPFLPPNGPRRIVVRSRHFAPPRERLEPARPDNPRRRHRPVVSARDVFWEISEGPCGKWQPSLSHSFVCVSRTDLTDGRPSVASRF